MRRMGSLLGAVVVIGTCVACSGGGVPPVIDAVGEDAAAEVRDVPSDGDHEELVPVGGEDVTPTSEVDAGQECNSDDDCPSGRCDLKTGSCVECLEDADCASGVCTDGNCCQPNCANKACGPDGCGGDCGECAEYERCNDVFSCVGPCDDCDQLNCAALDFEEDDPWWHFSGSASVQHEYLGIEAPQGAKMLVLCAGEMGGTARASRYLCLSKDAKVVNLVLKVVSTEMLFCSEHNEHTISVTLRFADGKEAQFETTTTILCSEVSSLVDAFGTKAGATPWKYVEIDLASLGLSDTSFTQPPQLTIQVSAPTSLGGTCAFIDLVSFAKPTVCLPIYQELGVCGLPVDCEKAEDCDDKDPCTQDACQNGKCVHQELPQCDLCGDGECAPGEEVTCPIDCATKDAGCFTHYEGGCGGCSCETCVCSVRPQCCFRWTNECVLLCQEHCGTHCDLKLGCGDHSCQKWLGED